MPETAFDPKGHYRAAAPASSVSMYKVMPLSYIDGIPPFTS